ncbi:MAG: hypothetical protein HY040_08670 [Planctomycetes bacterium]|nr:hypothetical protein [Planctomycetota bacterium]
MADQIQALILSALRRALAAPAGLPLLAARNGLFAATAAGKKAAQDCRARGLIRVVRNDAKGKSAQEIVTLSDEGLAHLLRETSPRPALEAILQAIQERHSELEVLVQYAREAQATLGELNAQARRLFDHFQEHRARPDTSLPATNGKHVPEPDGAVLACLGHWHERDRLEDCPLPELFRALQAADRSITIGQFHDSLRRLRGQKKIHLHPWTGPTYEIPVPALAVMMGHEIAYYASLKTPEVS